jgi:hypothetical protein
MGYSKELPIKPIIMVAADVLLEVVAGDDTVCIEQEPNRGVRPIKWPFFQMVTKPFLSILIYSTRCEYDILKVLSKKNDQNLPVRCVKHITVSC